MPPPRNAPPIPRRPLPRRDNSRRLDEGRTQDRVYAPHRGRQGLVGCIKARCCSVALDLHLAQCWPRRPSSISSPSDVLLCRPCLRRSSRPNANLRKCSRLPCIGGSSSTSMGRCLWVCKPEFSVPFFKPTHPFSCSLLFAPIGVGENHRALVMLVP